MALKTTQIQLKRKYRAEIAALKEAIHLQCFQCSGCQADGYDNCEIPDCPLYPFRLKRPLGNCSKTFQEKARKMKKDFLAE
jgi:hypothetical protein